ncbi:MAG TPA: hypothetical protein VG457_06790, partial [Planctomycetota bacterium]|nr:hypothetical protein [Planctomycetota bacterium]
MLSLAGAATLQAQDQDWEGRTISAIDSTGFVHEQKTTTISRTGLKVTGIMTRTAKDLAIKELFKTGKFETVDIEVKPDTADAANKVIVTIIVKEYIIVEKVEFKGINEIPLTTLKPNLRITGGEALNPFHLKQDRE